MTAAERLADWLRAFRLIHAARREQIRERAERRRRIERVRRLPIPKVR